MKLIIDIPEEGYDWIKNGFTDNEDKEFLIKAVKNGMPCDERPQGECRTCRHRDPEDKKCDCGGQERQGCPFPVSDDYYCKYYEKGNKK